MKHEIQTLFAIYKKGIHLSNEKGRDINAAIRKYLIAASYEESLNDKELVSLYSGKKAIKKSISYREKCSKTYTPLKVLGNLLDLRLNDTEGHQYLLK